MAEVPARPHDRSRQLPRSRAMVKPSALLALLLGATALASPALLVRSGSAKGTWNLPSASSTSGKMSGVLVHDATGAAVYTIHASLQFASASTTATPPGGTTKGLLHPVTPTASVPVPSHQVVGFFSVHLLPTMGPFPVYGGKFSAKLISISPVASPINLDGAIEGTFVDPAPTDGSFEGKWKIGF